MCDIFLLYMAYFIKHTGSHLHSFCCRSQSFILFCCWVVFHHVCMPDLVYVIINWYTFRLLPYSIYCKLTYCKYGSASSSLICQFPSSPHLVYSQGRNMWVVRRSIFNILGNFSIMVRPVCIAKNSILQYIDFHILPRIITFICTIAILTGVHFPNG